jgi:hypothetical protein
VKNQITSESIDFTTMAKPLAEKVLEELLKKHEVDNLDDLKYFATEQYDDGATINVYGIFIPKFETTLFWNDDVCKPVLYQTIENYIDNEYSDSELWYEAFGLDLPDPDEADLDSLEENDLVYIYAKYYYESGTYSKLQNGVLKNHSNEAIAFTKIEAENFIKSEDDKVYYLNYRETSRRVLTIVEQQ